MRNAFPSPQVADKGLINIQVFDTAGTTTFVPSADARVFEAIVNGAGGGSGGADGQGSSTVGAASSGGGGGFAVKVLTLEEISGQTITVGAGGTAGIAAAGNGGNGAASSVGSLVEASGGSGGTGHTATGGSTFISGGAGGSMTTGDWGGDGGEGGYGRVSGTTLGWVRPGGFSFFGAGAVGHSNTTADGIAPTSPGSGATGATCEGVATNHPGAAGADGIVVIYEYR